MIALSTELYQEAQTTPLGKLDVCFGDNNNYRKEKLEFKVMD
jgi:hypothetical protein